MRILFLLHRYLGIAVGLVMAGWCTSGVVMMYVSYPSLDAGQRMRKLAPITWQGCCQFESMAREFGSDVIDEFSVEMVARRPILRFKPAQGQWSVYDLLSGARINSFDREQAEEVASRYLGPADDSITYRERLQRDQWTVYGGFDRDRPLHRIALGDAHGTELYVSSRSGQVVQQTTASERFWNWIGAVTHWIYPTILRQHTAVWAQVVIWLSLVGAFLTLVGIYIGIVRLRAAKQGAWSPYRGVNRWHHIGGFVFGVLTLAWVISGFFSMNPWGLLESKGARAEREQLQDMWIDGSQMIAALKLLARNNLTEVTRVESAPFDGKLYLLLFRSERGMRVNAQTLLPAALSRTEMEHAAARVWVASEAAQLDLLHADDAYYYSHHEKREFPVYRVKLNDPSRTRFYLSAIDGDIVEKVDADRRWYRWLFEAAHRWDFTSSLRERPWWDVVLLPLLVGVGLVCFTGTYLAFRRVSPLSRHRRWRL